MQGIKGGKCKELNECEFKNEKVSNLRNHKSLKPGIKGVYCADSM